MRAYSYGEPQGRRIGKLGEFTLYEKTLVKGHVPNVEGEVERSDTMFNFVYGPSAGGLTETILFNMLTTGESIKSMSSDPTFKMRSLEVIGKRIDDAVPFIERVNGPFSASHSIAFLSAVEDAQGIDVDRNTMMSRIIEMELERIRNHLHVIARMCEAAAFGVPYNSLFYLRESVNRIISQYAGHRYFFGANGVGAVNSDFGGVSKSLIVIEKEVRELYNSLLESKIFLDRLQGNGIVTDLDCIGPAARGLGLRVDARADSGSLPYGKLGFSPTVEMGLGGDAMSRFLVRCEEISQSVELIKKAETKLGSHAKAKAHGSASGEGIGRVESPSGDVAYMVKLLNGRLRKIDLLSASSANLPVFQKSTRNNVFTDFHFNWESFGIWVSEIAVRFV